MRDVVGGAGVDGASVDDPRWIRSLRAEPGGVIGQAECAPPQLGPGPVRWETIHASGPSAWYAMGRALARWWLGLRRARSDRAGEHGA